MAESTVKHYITEHEDTVTITAEAALSSIAGSQLLKQEAKPLFDAAELLLGGGDVTVYEEMVQDVRCRFAGMQVPCLKDGGTDCFALWENDCCHSLMGGKAVGAASCVSACPAGMEIPAVLEHLRDRDRLEALRLVMKYNPMPAVACRICGRCESACVRGKHDQSVAVSGIMKALGDGIAAGREIFYAAPSGDSRKKIAIKGCGPFGLAAAFYLRKLGSHVCVIEQRPEKQLLEKYGETIPGFPAMELSEYIRALTGMGVIFLFGIQEPEESWDWILEGGEMERPDGTGDAAGYFLKELRRGYDAANKINLEIGLKSYIKPVKTFTAFDRDGVKRRERVLRDEPERPGCAPRDGGTDWEAVYAEAGRCLNCGCYGVNESCLRAVMTALDAEIRTNKRNIRALDFFGAPEPLKSLAEGEYIQEFELPKSRDYRSGFLYTPHHIGLAYAYLVCRGKIQDARIVYGGIAPVPVRMIGAEAFLRGKELSPEVIEAASGQVRGETVLMTDSGEKAEEMKRLLAESLTVGRNLQKGKWE